MDYGKKRFVEWSHVENGETLNHKPNTKTSVRCLRKRCGTGRRNVCIQQREVLNYTQEEQQEEKRILIPYFPLCF